MEDIVEEEVLVVVVIPRLFLRRRYRNSLADTPGEVVSAQVLGVNGWCPSHFLSKSCSSSLLS